MIDINEYKTEIVPIDSLVPNPKNPRTITKKQMDLLIKQIKKLGQYKPIIKDTRTGFIVGGHMRREALKLMGVKTVLVSYITSKDDAEALEYMLSDNQRNGVYSADDLANMIPDFPDFNWKDYSVDLKEPQSLQDLIDSLTPVDEDEVPEVSDEPAISQYGQVYQLGRHRLMCGDATKIEDVEKLMDGHKADMMFTDPPYGVDYGVNNKSLREQKGDREFHWSKTRENSQILGDDKGANELAEVLWRPAFKNMYEVAKDDCSFYMTMCQGGDQMMMMMMMMMSEKWQIKHELIWVKSSPVFSMGRLDYDYQHEPILFGWKLKHNFYGKGKFLKSIWEIPKPSKSDLHPTMKPIELVVNAIKNSSKEEDIVLDLFVGSGSTLIACEQTNRVFYGCELDPKYCDVIRKRYENFTAKQDQVSDK